MEYSGRPAHGDCALIPGLPNDIATLCIARIPLCSHLSISGVSVSWRSLLRGRALSQVRRELSLTEEWLYVWNELDDVWRCFDPSLGAWSKLPAMPADDILVGSAGTASTDGKLFVVGGYVACRRHTHFSGHIPSSVVTTFDARSCVWKRVADLNVARAECMTAILGDQLYVFGGSTAVKADGAAIFLEDTAEAEAYDIVADRWRKVAKMWTPLGLCPTAVLGGKFHASVVTEQRDFYFYPDPPEDGVSYDPKTDKWELATNAFDGRSHPWPAVQKNKSAVLYGKLYAVGGNFVMGNFPNGQEPEWYGLLTPAVRVYHPAINVWGTATERSDPDMVGFELGDFNLVAFNGMLCLVSIEDPCEHHDCATYTTIALTMLDVEESNGDLEYSAACVGDFEFQPEELRPTSPYTGNFPDSWDFRPVICQTITL